MRRAFAVIVGVELGAVCGGGRTDQRAAEAQAPRPRRLVRRQPAGVGRAAGTLVRLVGDRAQPRQGDRRPRRRPASTCRATPGSVAATCALADVAIPRLRPTRQATRRARLTIPMFAPEATYRLIGCANRPTKLKESSQRNNCRVAQARRPRHQGRTLGGPPPSSVPGGLSISPGTQSFGAVGVGAKSGVVVFTVTNTGSASTGTLGTSMVGADAAQFAPTADSCAGVSLSGWGDLLDHGRLRPHEHG